MPGDQRQLAKYQRLSGRAGALFTMHRLWRGADHLLLVQTAFLSEEYKRFYFRDIQAVTIVWSRSYAAWAIVLPFLALLFSGMFWSLGGAGVLCFTALPLMVVWLIHLFRGPTCKCWIHTGINKQHLKMFPRVSQARRFWNRIEPLLTEAQGVFSLEEMEAEGTLVDRRVRPVPPDLERAVASQEGPE